MPDTTSTPETVEPPKDQGWYLLAGLALAVAMVYAASGWLIDPTVGTIPYWLYVVYSQTAIYAEIVLIIVLIGLAFVWVIRVAQGTTRGRIPTLAGSIILVSSAIGLVALFPSLSQRLYHRDTGVIAGSLYYLAFHEVMDNNNTFVLYQCDRLGVLCTPRYMSRIYPLLPDEGPISLMAQLVPGEPPNSLDVVVEGEIIHTHETRRAP
jgi:hypothetical protein